MESLLCFIFRGPQFVSKTSARSFYVFQHLSPFFPHLSYFILEFAFHRLQRFFLKKLLNIKSPEYFTDFSAFCWKLTIIFSNCCIELSF